MSVRDRALGLSALDAASFDAVIDLGGRAPLGQLQRLVREGGASVSVAVGENRVGPIGRLLGLSLRSIGSRRPMRALFATPRPELTTQLLDLAATGALVPVIDSVFALDDADAALGRMDAGGVVGKVLVAGGSIRAITVDAQQIPGPSPGPPVGRESLHVGGGGGRRVAGCGATLARRPLGAKTPHGTARRGAFGAMSAVPCEERALSGVADGDGPSR